MRSYIMAEHRSGSGNFAEIKRNLKQVVKAASIAVGTLKRPQRASEAGKKVARTATVADDPAINFTPDIS
ncbi:stress-induced protein [Salmonella enterica subsp. enterica]|nr:stress-induced protein [Salmonella enterica subsp. enterica]